jgi:hypothetical protein
MNRDYLQLALATFNNGNWYGWKKEDDNGNKIPNSERMQYQHIKIIKDGATMPTEAEVNAKIQELKDAEQAANEQNRSRCNRTSIRNFPNLRCKWRYHNHS